MVEELYLERIKANDYPSGATFGVPVYASTANIRISLECLEGTNTLAYLRGAQEKEKNVYFFQNDLSLKFVFKMYRHHS